MLSGVTPHPLWRHGQSVREAVTDEARNVRAKSAVHGRGTGQSTDLIQPRTKRGQEPSVSVNNPRPRSVHANNRFREQSMSPHRHRPRSSVNVEWQGRNQSAALAFPMECPCPQSVHIQWQATSASCPRQWQFRAQSAECPRKGRCPRASRPRSGPKSEYSLHGSTAMSRSSHGTAR